VDLHGVPYLVLLHGLRGLRRVNGGKEGLKATFRDHVALKE